MTSIHRILKSNICPNYTNKQFANTTDDLTNHNLGFLLRALWTALTDVTFINCSRQVLHQFRERDLRRLHYREDLQRPEAQHHPHRPRRGQLHLAPSSQILHQRGQVHHTSG